MIPMVMEWKLPKPIALVQADIKPVFCIRPLAEVKSDLMGEQTILCGLLQTGSILSFNKMVEKGIDAGFASKLVQYGWETITEALKSEVLPI